MSCPACGAPISQGSRFCNMCGATVASPVAVTTVSPHSVQPGGAQGVGEHRIWEVRPAFLFVGFRYAVAALLWIAASAAVSAAASWFSLSAGVGALIVLGLGVLLFLPAVIAHIKRQRVLYTLTNYKLEVREGLIATTVRNIPIAKIQDVTVTRSILERLLGVGSITIDNAAEISGSVTIRAVREPQKYADELLAELRRRN